MGELDWAFHGGWDRGDPLLTSWQTEADTYHASLGARYYAGRTVLVEPRFRWVLTENKWGAPANTRLEISEIVEGSLGVEVLVGADPKVLSLGVESTYGQVRTLQRHHRRTWSLSANVTAYFEGVESMRELVRERR